jgi:hypothetical protein
MTIPGSERQAAMRDARRGKSGRAEWLPGEIYPLVAFIVTNLARGAYRVVVIYNQFGTAEQHIKQGKSAVKWNRLSCRTMRGNAVRLPLHALVHNFANFLRTLALPEEVKHWTLTSIRDRLTTIGAKLVINARYATLPIAELAMPRDMFHRILATSRICDAEHPPDADCYPADLLRQRRASCIRLA